MAVLKMFVNEDKNQIEITIHKHDGEKDTDLSYKWAKYALGLSIQLNYNLVETNPFAKDQGAYIHFLNKDILEKNELDSYGQPCDYDDYYEDEDDFSNYRVYADSTFTPESIEEARDFCEENTDAINILLDRNQAFETIGGALTATSTSSYSLHEALKEAATRLYNKK